MDLLGIPARGSPLLFCLFSKGMSEGALSPLLIHLLPLVYVTDCDLGPSPSLINKYTFRFSCKSLQKGSLSFCMLASSSFCLCVCLCEGLNELESKVNLPSSLWQCVSLGARQGHDLAANSHPRRVVERRGRVVDQQGPDNGIHWPEHSAHMRTN